MARRCQERDQDLAVVGEVDLWISDKTLEMKIESDGVPGRFMCPKF